MTAPPSDDLDRTDLDTDLDDHLHGDEVDPGAAADDAADEDGLFPAPVSTAPHTGVPAVDDALADLEQGARADDLDAQLAAGERAHRELQAQLDDLGTA